MTCNNWSCQQLPTPRVKLTSKQTDPQIKYSLVFDHFTGKRITCGALTMSERAMSWRQDSGPPSLCLTPRIRCKEHGVVFVEYDVRKQRFNTLGMAWICHYYERYRCWASCPLPGLETSPSHPVWCQTYLSVFFGESNLRGRKSWCWQGDDLRKLLLIVVDCLFVYVLILFLSFCSLSLSLSLPLPLDNNELGHLTRDTRFCRKRLKITENCRCIRPLGFFFFAAQP